MAKKTAPEIQSPGTDLATFVPDNPLAVLTSTEKFDALLGKIEAEVNSHVPDLETAKGRAAIKSLAYKVTRTKTTLDDAGKKLNADKHAEIDAVDAVRRDIRSKLDALAEKARKPLDEWEAAEAKRQEHIAGLMKEIDVLVDIGADAPSAEIDRARDRLAHMTFDADLFQEWLEIAVAKKSAAHETLGRLFDRAVQAEADAAELAELRRQNAERELAAQEAAAADADKARVEQAERDRLAEINRQAEREAEAASVAAAHAREEAEREAQAKIDAANAEAERLRKEADDKAEAERKAAEELRATEARAAQAKIDAANAETERLRKVAAAEEAERKKVADEQAARDADRAHRQKIMKAAKEAIMECGVKEPEARSLVLAIISGEIPNVKLTF